MQQRLIVGLGNPGQKYLETRHNAGFLLLDRLVTRYRATLSSERGPYVLWTAETDEQAMFLMEPLTYMNRSGHALASFLEHHPIPLEYVLVVYDDIALPLGVLRARAGGSAGGQKGMGHIIECLGTRDIPRLRIGIDSPLRGNMPLPEFVLADFSDEELPQIRKALDSAEEAVALWLEAGIARVMASINSRVSPPPTPPCESVASIDGNGNGGES